MLAGLTATACAPQTSDNSAKEDEKSGTLRVWLFQKVVSGRKDVAAAPGDAAKKMNDAFGAAR